MRFITIKPDFFQYQLDSEQLAFYRKKRNAFKKMWLEQGKTYWLRFLLTYQMSFEDFVEEHQELDKFVMSHDDANILEFVFINIHKHFIEKSIEKVEGFLDHAFKTTQNFQSKSGEKYHHYSNIVLNEFNNIWEKENGDDETYSKIHTGLICFLCFSYYGFIDGAINLLKKWLKEPDLSKDEEKSIDLTLYYWKPVNQHWSCKDYMPSCFEKYLAFYYKDELPKILMTGGIHNTFNIHTEKGECCSLYREEDSLFGLLKKKFKFRKPNCARAVSIYKPDVTYCGEHNNCCLKIIHDNKCLEPYVCFGDSPCKLTCEFNYNKSNDAVKSVIKKSSIEVFPSKSKKTRSVLINVESSYTEIVTFLPFTQDHTEAIYNELEKLFLPHFDPGARNALYQHERKEELRRKLRKKYKDRYEYDYSDPMQIKDMFEEAHSVWINELCLKNFKDILINGNEKSSDPISLFKKSLTSVAIGTCGLVFGCVVLPSKLCSTNSKDIVSEIKTGVQKNTKKKKNKTKTEITFKQTNSKSICQIDITTETVNISNHSTVQKSSKSSNVSEACLAKVPKSTKLLEGDVPQSGGNFKSSIKEKKESVSSNTDISNNYKASKEPVSEIIESLNVDVSNDSATKKYPLSENLNQVSTKISKSTKLRKRDVSQSDKNFETFVEDKKETVFPNTDSPLSGGDSKNSIKEATETLSAIADSLNNSGLLKDIVSKMVESVDLGVNDSTVQKNSISENANRISAVDVSKLMELKKEVSDLISNFENSVEGKKDVKMSIKLAETESNGELSTNKNINKSDVHDVNLSDKPEQAVTVNEASQTINEVESVVNTIMEKISHVIPMSFSSNLILEEKLEVLDRIRNDNSNNAMFQKLNGEIFDTLNETNLNPTTAEEKENLDLAHEEILSNICQKISGNIANMTEHFDANKDTPFENVCIKETKTIEAESLKDNDEELDALFSFLEKNKEKVFSDAQCNGATELIDKHVEVKLNDEEVIDKTIQSFVKKDKLKICAFCQKRETKCKTFKRCSKCKADNFPDHYYYCSRDCQIEDWKISHREMHMKREKLKL